MGNKGRIYGGLVLVLLGVLLLLSRVFDVDLGAFCWPVALILLGAWLIARPRMVGEGRRVVQRLLGDVRRRGPWTVTDEEIWLGVGDVHLDLTEAEIPADEPTLHVYGFVGELRLTVPKDVGVSITSSGVLTSARIWSGKEDQFLTTFTRRTPNYEQAERRVHIKTSFFVLDLRVRQESA